MPLNAMSAALLPAQIQLAGIAIDLDRERLVDREGKPIALRRQSFAVLRYLHANAGRVVTKDELMTAIWPGLTVTEDSLVQCIADIRRALGALGHELLKTIPRRGYLLEFTAAPEPSSANANAPESAAAGRSLPASNIPIRVPTHFIGREEALSAIEASLARYGGRVAITALHGLRGVGKTTVAAAFAERHRARFRATWWVRSQTQASIRADLIGLGARLGWVAADAAEEPALATVMERLWHEGEGLLLIFDDASDANALKPYLPRGGGAEVIVTSNAHAWRGVAEPVELRLWPKEIGADYLVSRTGREGERAVAERLSETLGGLPLAHEQAAAYCEQLDVSLAEYERRFLQTPLSMLGDARHAPSEYHDGLTVAGTFALAIDAAAKQHEAAEPLMALAAQLAPEPIPVFLLSEVREKLGEPLASALDGVGLDEVLAALRSFSLVDRRAIPDERDPTIVTDTIRLHRLVREVASSRCSPEAASGMVSALVEAMVALYPSEVGDGPVAWAKVRRLDGLARALLDAPQTRRSAATADLLMLVAHQGSIVGQGRTSGLLLERAVGIREEVLGSDHPQTAIAIGALGSFRAGEGALAEARQLLERALRTLERVEGPDHPDTAQTLLSLAILMHAQGDFAGARSVGERAATILQSVLPPDDPRTARGLDVLAQMRENLADAGVLLERGLRITETVLGPEHPATAGSLVRLGSLRRRQSQLATARPLLERALTILEKVFGDEHPETAICLGELARLHHQSGELVPARTLYERVLEINERTNGPGHPSIAATVGGLASVIQFQGDLTSAQTLYQRALEATESLFGPDHHATAGALSDLAQLLHARGNFESAKTMLERAQSIQAAALGPTHMNTLRTVGQIGQVLRSQGDLPTARTLLEGAAQTTEKSLGADHPETTLALMNLAEVMMMQGDLAAAKVVSERAVGISEDVNGPGHPYTGRALNNLGNVLQLQGDLTTARQICERALAIAETTFGPDHSVVGTRLGVLGNLLHRLGELADARPLLERALRINEKVSGPDHPNTSIALSQLGCLAQSSGDLATAEPILERALQIANKTFGPKHPNTNRVRRHLANLMLETDRPSEALSLGEAALAVHLTAFGPEHPWTKDSAKVVSDALTALGRLEEAEALGGRLGESVKARA